MPDSWPFSIAIALWLGAMAYAFGLIASFI
jgi:hypothetical protein